MADNYILQPNFEQALNQAYGVGYHHWITPDAGIRVTQHTIPIAKIRFQFRVQPVGDIGDRFMEDYYGPFVGGMYVTSANRTMVLIENRWSRSNMFAYFDGDDEEHTWIRATMGYTTQAGHFRSLTTGMSSLRHGLENFLTTAMGDGLQSFDAVQWAQAVDRYMEIEMGFRVSRDFLPERAQNRFVFAMPNEIAPPPRLNDHHLLAALDRDLEENPLYIDELVRAEEQMEERQRRDLADDEELFRDLYHDEDRNVDVNDILNPNFEQDINRLLQDDELDAELDAEFERRRRALRDPLDYEMELEDAFARPRQDAVPFRYLTEQENEGDLAAVPVNVRQVPADAVRQFRIRQRGMAGGSIVDQSIAESVMQRRRQPLRRVTRSQAARMKNKSSSSSSSTPGPGGEGRMGSSYSDWKQRKLFRRGSVDGFFKFTNVCIYPPHVGDPICFAMSFMKAQLRSYALTDNKIQSISETKPKELACFFEEIDADWEIRVPLEDFSADIVERDFIDPDGKIVLFNPYKELIRGGQDGLRNEYRTEYDEDYLLDWYLAARYVHMYVEEKLGRAVDYTYEAEACRAYAEVFRVNIHLCCVLGVGKRYCTYENPQKDRTRHIHLVLEDQHVSAVTDIRLFMSRSTSALDIQLHNFCDFCYSCTTNNNINRQEGYKHIEYCMQNNKVFRNDELMVAKSKLSNELNTASRLMKNTYHHCITCDEWRLKSVRKQCINENHSIDDQTKHVYLCRDCGVEFVSVREMDDHLCNMKLSKLETPVANHLLWVYDTEACQTLLPQEDGASSQILKHTCNLVIIRAVYDSLEHPTSERCFDTIDDFCKALLEEEQFRSCIFLAHNGSGYDSQYILQYCEFNQVVYDRVPHPSSTHKSLSMMLHRSDGQTVQFLDFMAFVPGSLRSIGKSFGLPICKGDFPHMFSVPENQNYIGSIPSMEDEEKDYFGMLHKRTKEEQEELRKWYEKEKETVCSCVEYEIMGNNCVRCGKQSWNFKEELKKYCLLDVRVLSECVRLYRDAMIFPAERLEQEETEWWQQWRCPSLDPFRYMTMSQVAIQLFAHGFPDDDPLVLASSQYSNRDNYHPLSAHWIGQLNEERKLNGCTNFILYRGNRIREYYSYVTNKFYDGYLPDPNGRRNGTVYICRNCEYYACTKCQTYEKETSFHKKRNIRVNEIRKQVELETWRLRKEGYLVEEIWSCEIEPPLQFVPLIEDREMLYGGRTEVHYAYYEPKENEDIASYDVCSMYPFVCAFRRLPTGHPLVLTGSWIQPERLHPDHPEAYWGFAKVRIQPNRKDRLGLLPSRDPDTGRLEFNLLEKVGTYHTEELYLAIRQGYVVEEIIQVYHWDNENSREDLFRGYVDHFIRIKQQAEGWKKNGATAETPEEEEKDRVVESMFISNGRIGKMDKNKVKISPVQRHLAKIFLNCLWGKYIQMQNGTFQTTINGKGEYDELLCHPNIEKTSITFRHVKENVFRVNYKKIEDNRKGRNCYNIWLGSSVTAHARTILNKKSLEVGADKVLYTDTDSVYVVEDENSVSFAEKGLGKWTKEHDDIELFIAIAPKNYFCELEDKEEMEMKTKGVKMDMNNKRKVNRMKLEEMIACKLQKFQHEDDMHRETSIMMDNFTIFSNSTSAKLPYAQLCTRLNTKIMQSVLTKRQLVPYYNKDEDGEIFQVDMREVKKARLLPFGHEDLDLDPETLSRKIYN